MHANFIRSLTVSIMAAACVAPCFGADAAGDHTRKGQILDRGRYLVKIGGCNDCHTPGYGEADGKVPESQWLVGVPVGWKGPWGTTYAANLRTYFMSMSADQWVRTAHTLKTRPPMPWFTVDAMTNADLRAMHAFITSLGSAGSPAPAYVPPGAEPTGPVITFPGPPPKQ